MARKVSKPPRLHIPMDAMATARCVEALRLVLQWEPPVGREPHGTAEEGGEAPPASQPPKRQRPRVGDPEGANTQPERRVP